MQNENYMISADVLSEAVVVYRYLDGEPQLEHVNASLRQMMGEENTPVVGSGYGDMIYAIRPEDRPAMSDALEQLEKTGSCSAQIRIELYDGKIHWMQCTARLMEDENGKGSVFAFADITDRRELIEREHGLFSCLQLLTSERDWAAGMNQVMEHIDRYYTANRVYVFEFEWDTFSMFNTFEYVAPDVTAEKDNLQNLPVDLVSYWLEKFRQGEPVFIENVAALRNIPGRMSEFDVLAPQGIESLMVVPIYRENSLYGYVGVDDPKRHQDDHTYLESVAAYLSHRFFDREQQQLLYKLSYVDSLTGLANRNGLTKRIHQLAAEKSAGVGVAFADVNGLKEINDRYGHERGDWLICQAAQKLSAFFPKGDVFRISGDEFVVVLSSCPKEEFDAVLKNATEKQDPKGKALFAIGGIWDAEAENVAGLVLDAEKLMYAHKREYYASQLNEGTEADLKGLGQRIAHYLLPQGELTERQLFDGLSHAATNVYLFENDVRANVSHWSAGAVSYFNLPEDYTTHALEVWTAHIHPDDRKAYLEDLEAMFSGAKARHNCQYRAKNAEGDYVWIKCVGELIPGADGTPAYFVGMMTRLDDQSVYDPVTKSLSVGQFHQEALVKPCALMLLGMDEFRRIINSFGYDEGDRALRLVADILKEENEEATIYRMTGDEFLMVMPDCTEEEGKQLFQRMLSHLQEAGGRLGYGNSLIFSGGMLRFQPGDNTRERALRQLEHCMEQAKSQGGGQLVMFSDKIEQKHLRVQQLRNAMSNAIENNYQGFMLYFQPVTKAGDGRIDALEVLLRFSTPELGMVSPVEFIPILEKTREIRLLGLWVMEQTVRQKRLWANRYPGLRLAFNVSYLQLYNEDFINRLIEIAKWYRVDPHGIIVELTESCKVSYPLSLASMLTKLRNEGFLVALDDFGMDQSSFSLVRDLPVDTIKIDHSFVRTLGSGDPVRDNANMAIISSICYLGKALGTHVVVEGIETGAVAQKAKELGADYLQGFYYSRPAPVDEIEKLLDAFNPEPIVGNP